MGPGLPGAGPGAHTYCAGASPGLVAPLGHDECPVLCEQRLHPVRRRAGGAAAGCNADPPGHRAGVGPLGRAGADLAGLGRGRAGAGRRRTGADAAGQDHFTGRQAAAGTSLFPLPAGRAVWARRPGRRGIARAPRGADNRTHPGAAHVGGRVAPAARSAAAPGHHAGELAHCRDRPRTGSAEAEIWRQVCIIEA